MCEYERYGYHHELLDRLYCISEMWDTMITDHDSNDILPEKEKYKVAYSLGQLYQLVGQRISENEDKENKNDKNTN